MSACQRPELAQRAELVKQPQAIYTETGGKFIRRA